MARGPWWLLVLGLGAWGAGCSTALETLADADAGADASAADDAGEADEDGGAATGGTTDVYNDVDAGDAGDPDKDFDASVPPVEDAGELPPADDGGVEPDVDAGTEPVDAGVPDAGAVPPDAGPAHVDAGTVTPDAGHARRLATSVVAHIVEPEGRGHDDQAHAYTDKNYWNFCVPGALTAALYYFKPTNVTQWPAAHFKEPSHAPSTIPSNGTYWKSVDTVSGYTARGRSYLMYMAMKVKPPNFSSPGVVSFATYPTTGGGLGDARDALNWEASGHASGWRNFFYVAVGASSVTTSTFHRHVKQDIDGGHAVVVFASTAYLPNWSRTLHHAITVIGYDDDAHTYTYVDTCGKRCNGATNSRNGGTWTVSQADMTRAASHGVGYLW